MQRRADKPKRLSSHDLKQREITRNFNHLAKQVLIPLEREALHKFIRRYQRNRNVSELYQSMVFILTTHEKQQLFPYIRSMIPESDRSEFDHYMASDQKVRRDSYIKLSPPPTKHGNFLHPSSAARKSAPTYQQNVKVIMLKNDKSSETLGFSIRGGLEYGLGIYISQVDPLSAADVAGLEVGDEILEVNNIDLKNVALSGAVGVLTGSNKLKLVVNRMRKVPEWKKSKETTIWFDVRKKKMVPLPSDERMMDNQTIRERLVVLRVLKSSDFIGMNIRGGNEYNLGIYVSRLDQGGLAEKNGICLGDQIVAVNGTTFENVNHTSAVEFLRAHKTLRLTLKAVGRYPAYKEVYQEYTWSESMGRLDRPPPENRLTVNETPINSRFSLRQQESPQTRRNHYVQNPTHQGRLSLQKEVLLPRKHDITYSAPYEDAWTSSGFGDEEHNGSSETFTNSNGRHAQNGFNTDYTESDSGQDDYTAFLERKAKQDNEKSYSREATLQARYHPERKSKLEEMSTSFSSPQLNIAEDGTVRTYILPDQHRTLHQSQPDIQITQPTEEYAPVLRRPKSSKNTGMIYVQNHDQPGNYASPIYAAVQKKNLKSTEEAYQPYRQQMSKSTPSLVKEKPQPRVYSAYDDFHMYNRTQRLEQSRVEDPETDYDVDSSEAVVVFSENENDEPKHSSNVYSTIEDATNMNIEDAHLSDDEFENSNVENRILLLENRKSNLGSCEISRMADEPTLNGVISSPPHSPRKNSNGAWATIKKKLKGSEKGKKKKKEIEDAPRSVSKRRGMFEQSFGSQVVNNHCVDNYNMMMMEEHARNLLNEDECAAVIRHVKNYHEQKNLERLTEALLQILDTSEKLQLLKDIRGVIYPYHIALFDTRVNIYEIQEYERMSTKLHLPLHHNHKQTSKPQKNLMTTVMDIADDGGHFHIKTVDQHKRDIDHEKEVIHELKSSQHLSSDSDSDSGKEQAYDFTRQDPVRRDNSEDSIIVYISKQKLHLGLLLTGGEGEYPSPVRVDKILPSGAAADDANIQPGMILLSVDDQSLKFKSLNQVQAALKKSYNNKRSVAMKLVLKPIIRY
ncbi:hypothetical protein SNE40_012808 [Patella caerulea]|uniref:PDZ domain-containing protein n=1 Tax=Patella caerulea TaxID=87958 RepID=A0AAN8JKY7_PATCE